MGFPRLSLRFLGLAGLVWAVVSAAPLSADDRAPVPETGLPNPALAMGLNGISDWSSQHPFVDIMKTARPWIGHLSGQWGGWEADRLEAEGYLSSEGWPLGLPAGVDRLEALILTDQPAAARGLAGRYVVRYRGTGRLTVVGQVEDVRARPGEIRFSYRPGAGSVALSLRRTDPQGSGDFIRDISVVRAGHLALFEVGALFNPDWLRHVRDLRVLRFMDWMATNGSEVQHWQDRPLPGDYSYARWGVPLEVMVELANQIGADPWFTMPHRADDAYNRNFARYVRDYLNPDLRAYVEYSNELWNFIMPQANWARDQARARWGAAAGEDAWMQFAGMRAAQVMQLWSEVFGAEAEVRLRRVVAVHTAWPGLEEPLLEAPLWRTEGGEAPAEAFDAYAVTGYFGHELGGDDFAPQLLEWIKQGDATRRAAEVLRAGSLEALISRFWPYHARVARRYGMDLVMYEGGSHVAGHGDWVNNAALTAFFSDFNYSPEMAALYRELMAGWRAVGGTLFNAFVDVAVPSKWGSWGGLRHNDDINPRWAALMRYNATAPADWEARAPGSFEHGVIRNGTPGGDHMEGTPGADVLLGEAGDDILIPGGGEDRVHGGAGTDRVVLEGTEADYRLFWQEGRLIAEGPTGRVTMVAVEQLSFSAAPERMTEVMLR